MTKEDMLQLAGSMAEIVQKHNLVIESCAEQIDLQSVGIPHGSCIDRKLIEKIIGCSLIAEKDKNQRTECGCVESVEVGTYNTCLNGCKYCYANFNDARVNDSVKLFDVNFPLLCGIVGKDDKITDRRVKSLKDHQIRLFGI